MALVVMILSTLSWLVAVAVIVDERVNAGEQIRWEAELMFWSILCHEAKTLR